MFFGRFLAVCASCFACAPIQFRLSFAPLRSVGVPAIVPQRADGCSLRTALRKMSFFERVAGMDALRYLLHRPRSCAVRTV